MMVIHPPNVTEKLHLGHTLTNSVKDAITRYYISSVRFFELSAFKVPVHEWQRCRCGCLGVTMRVSPPRWWWRRSWQGRRASPGTISAGTYKFVER